MNDHRSNPVLFPHGITATEQYSAALTLTPDHQCASDMQKECVCMSDHRSRLLGRARVL